MAKTRDRRESDSHNIVRYYPQLLDKELKGIKPKHENPYSNLLRPDFRFYYYRCDKGNHSIPEDSISDNSTRDMLCPICKNNLQRIVKIVEIKAEKLSENDVNLQLIPYLEEEEKEASISRRIEGILLGYPPSRLEQKSIYSAIKNSKFDISLRLIGRDFPSGYDQIVLCAECRQPFMRIAHGVFRCPEDGCREFLQAGRPH